MTNRESVSKPDAAKSAKANSPQNPEAITLPDLMPMRILQLQRTVGNRATRHLLQASAPSTMIQRSVYLANEDDYIYKAEGDDTGEYAYLLKYKTSTPLFIQYAAIERLRADPTVAALVKNNHGSEFDLQKDLIDLLSSKKSPLANGVKAALGNVYFYDGKAGQLEKQDFNAHLYARAISAAVMNGAKAYAMGGGERLPAASGHVFALKANKETILGALGYSKEKAAEFTQVHVVSLQDEITYQKYLEDAKKNKTNYFEYNNDDLGLHFFYISAVEVRRNANAKIQIDNKRYSDTDFFNLDKTSEEGKRIEASFAKLGKPTPDTGWVPGTSLNKKDRGDGQAKAMNNWNAMGAAAYAKHYLGVDYPLDQNWEWLHIRGAQIGGATDNTNLIPGLYVTNSFMIPYENMIAQWARADASHLWARFSVSPSNTLFGRYITISIKTQGHSMLGTLETTLCTFDALQGRVVDKLANEIVKRGIDQRATVDD